MIPRITRVALMLLLLRCATFGGHTTKVQVAAWSGNSERIEKIWVKLTSILNGKEYNGSGGVVELPVQTAEYYLEVSAPGFLTSRQVLRAYGPRVFRSEILAVAAPHGSKHAGISGRVVNYSGDFQQLRVRLMSMYGTQVSETFPDKNGAFDLPANEGPYVLMVLADHVRGIGIIDSRTVLIPYANEETMNIDLKGKQETLVSSASN